MFVHIQQPLVTQLNNFHLFPTSSCLFSTYRNLVSLFWPPCSEDRFGCRHRRSFVYCCTYQFSPPSHNRLWLQRNIGFYYGEYQLKRHDTLCSGLLVLFVVPLGKHLRMLGPRHIYSCARYAVPIPVTMGAPCNPKSIDTCEGHISR